jgi:hypothetical protein
MEIPTSGMIWHRQRHAPTATILQLFLRSILSDKR